MWFCCCWFSKKSLIFNSFFWFVTRLLKDALGCCPDCRLIVVESELRKLYLKFDSTDMSKEKDKNDRLQQKYDDLKAKFDALEAKKVATLDVGKPKIRTYKKVCYSYLLSNQICI